jgi:hypothetical protein
MAPRRVAVFDTYPASRNPIFDEELWKKHNSTPPTGVEGSTELVGGTRLNPKILTSAESFV